MVEVPKKKIVSIYFSLLRSLLCLHMIRRCRPLVFLRMLQFREIWFGTVQFSASYANLGQPHIFNDQV